MSDIRVDVQQRSVSRPVSGLRAVRGTQDGSISVAPWVQMLILEGLGFTAQFGAAAEEDTDPGTFGAGGVDLTEADMLQTLPSDGSVGIIPIYWKPVFEAIGTIAAIDALLVYGSGAVIGANSIAVNAKNLRPDSSTSSSTTLRGLADTGGTAITIAGYIYREGGTHLTGVAGTGQTLMPEWSIGKAGFAPVIVGASRQVAAFASGQASTGFMHYQWLEMPKAYFD